MSERLGNNRVNRLNIIERIIPTKRASIKTVLTVFISFLQEKKYYLLKSRLTRTIT